VSEETVAKLLKQAKINECVSYRPSQIMTLLNISQGTFRGLCNTYEPNTRHGIESYLIGTHRRVPHHALVEYLSRNNSYEVEMQ